MLISAFIVNTWSNSRLSLVPRRVEETAGEFGITRQALYAYLSPPKKKEVA